MGMHRHPPRLPSARRIAAGLHEPEFLRIPKYGAEPGPHCHIEGPCRAPSNEAPPTTAWSGACLDRSAHSRAMQWAKKIRSAWLGIGLEAGIGGVRSTDHLADGRLPVRWRRWG